MPRQRLDALLVERGLFATRAQARAAVLAGEVRVAGTVVDKPGAPVADDAELAVAARPRFVSRGGDKLDHAMVTLGVAVDGRGRPRPRQLDRRVRRPPAAGRRGARRRRRRRLRPARLAPARRPAGDGARAHERARPDARTSTVPAVICHRRPVVHLPDGGPGAGARMPARRLPRPRARQAAVRGRARARRQGGRREGPGGAPRGARPGSERGSSSAAPPCSASATRGIPDRRGTWSTSSTSATGARRSRRAGKTRPPPPRAPSRRSSMPDDLPHHARRPHRAGRTRTRGAPWPSSAPRASASGSSC